MLRVLLAALLLLPALRARAQNRPPIARVAATPNEVLLGEPIAFVGSSSIDPDMGPSPLGYEWDFGDETASTEADPAHTYAAPGAYDVSVTVRDGLAQSIASTTVHVLDPPTSTPPSASSMLWLDEARRRLWAVSPDAGSVTVVDVDTLEVAAEISVGAHPASIAGDGARVFVPCRDAGVLTVIDADAMTVRATLSLGAGPSHVARVPTDGTLLVTLEAEDRLLFLAPDGSAVRDAIELADGPRAIAVTHDGARAFVTHFLSRGASGAVTAVDLSDRSATEISLADDPGPDTATSGRGVPNLLGAIAIEPSGALVWIGGLKANTNRGTYLSGEPFPFTNRLRALMAPVGASALDDRVDRRLDANDTDSVSAIAFDARGRWAFLAHAGAGRVSVYDMSLARGFVRGVDADLIDFAARVDVGHAPRALALGDGDARLYVLNELSRDLTVLDVTAPSAPVEVATIPLTAEPLPPEVARGKRLFHRSREPRHSQDNYIACASCHPDAGSDGRTWDFTQFGEGLRNTIDLRGRGGVAHGPLHWSANFDEVQDFENDIVSGFGGDGLAGDGAGPHPPLASERNAGRSEDLDALAAYLAFQTEAPWSPHRGPGRVLTDAARRGREVFARAGCEGCHAPPRYTDSTLTADPADYVLYDVGTLGPGSGMRLGGPLEGIDTPSLIGLWDSAPYLHDGSAATLREVLVDRNPDDRHGATSALSAGELDDLIAFLRELDGHPDEPAPPMPDAGPTELDGGTPRDAAMTADGGAGGASEGCGCRVGATAPQDMHWFLLLGAALAWRRRWKRRGERP